MAKNATTTATPDLGKMGPGLKIQTTKSGIAALLEQIQTGAIDINTAITAAKTQSRGSNADTAARTQYFADNGVLSIVREYANAHPVENPRGPERVILFRMVDGNDAITVGEYTRDNTKKSEKTETANA